MHSILLVYLRGLFELLPTGVKDWQETVINFKSRRRSTLITCQAGTATVSGPAFAGHRSLMACFAMLNLDDDHYDFHALTKDSGSIFRLYSHHLLSPFMHHKQALES